MSLITYTYRPEDRATGGPLGPANVIVLHTLECPTGIDPVSGNGYARMLTGPNYLGQRNMAKIKSVHFVVGVQDICASCPEDTIAWHARGASYGSYSIEQEGRAAFTEYNWSHGDGKVITTNTGLLVGYLANKYGIPIRFLSGQALRNAYADHSNIAAGGVTTHAQLTLDKITETGPQGLNDHSDPGDAYPIDYVLSVARGEAKPVELDVYDWLFCVE